MTPNQNAVTERHGAADPMEGGHYHAQPPHFPERRQGVRRYAHGDQRTAGWLEGPIETHLCCPRKHHVKDGTLALGEHVLRCTHRDAAGARECGLLLWLLVVRGGAVFVAEVDIQDVRTIKTHAGPHETLRYLGAQLWPRVAMRR